VAIVQDEAEERTVRIDMILEELRLNTEDLRELSKQARARALAMREEAQATHTWAQSRTAQAIRRARRHQAEQ